MAKTSDTGVKQNKDGSWSYRLVRMVNGKRTDVGGSVDEFGNSYKTRKAALSAREARIQELKNNIKKTGSLKPMTIAEVYQNYLGGEALSKET